MEGSGHPVCVGLREAKNNQEQFYNSHYLNKKGMELKLTRLLQ